MNCRKINKEVVQVLVFPVKLTNTYIARVYLKSEDAGKQFIISYPFKKELLTSFYKDSSNIKFNINVDDKTFHKIKNMKKRGK